jgi:hypothetical protein
VGIFPVMKSLILLVSVVLAGQSVLAVDKKHLTKEMYSLHLSVGLNPETESHRER